MAVTIEEIARRAGVSAGTVSRILNGKNKENRPAIAKRAKRIRQIALEMGYRPNAAARSMIRGRFGMVALLTCGELGFDWFPDSLLHGIHYGLEVHDTRLVLNEVIGTSFTDPEFVPKLFQESAVDGVIVNIDSKLPSAAIPYLESQPLPIVLLNRKQHLKSVYPDDMMGGRLATEYLLNTGRREIGFFKLRAPTPEPHYSIHDRHVGFKLAMESAGLSPHRVRLGCPDYRATNGSGMACAAAFLEAFPDVTGIVCYDLIEAVALHAVAAQRGIRLGSDLDLIVFHEREIHRNVGIHLHTMLIPFKQMGIEAANMVMAPLDGGAPSEGSLAVPYTEVYNATKQAVVPLPGATGALADHMIN